MTDVFRMQIKDVFRFADDRTAIVGSVEGGEQVMILPGPATVLVNGKPVAQVEIESESLFSRQDDLSLRGLRDLRAVTTQDKVNLTKEMIKGCQCLLEGRMRLHQHRHLIGIESPPDNFVPDTMTLGPRLPEGWDGDAWTTPDESQFFLRAWNKKTGRYAVGRGARYEEARQNLLQDIETGTGRAVVEVKKVS